MTRHIRIASWTVGLCLAAVAASSASASTISTLAPWNDDGNDGYISTLPVGQTFKVGTDTHLSQFTFWLELDTSLPFTFTISKWDATHRTTTGPTLLSLNSDAATLDPNAPSVYNAYAFTFTPNVDLTAGSTYIASISAFGSPTHIGALNVDGYADGAMYRFRNNAWSPTAMPDAAFQATFTTTNPNDSSPVPLPAAAPLGITLLAPLAFARRLRKTSR